MSSGRHVLHLLGAALGTLALGACHDSHCESDSGEICTIAGTGNPGFSGDNGPAQEADLYRPQDLTEGPDGQLYVADWANHRIRVITDDGRIQTVAGSGNVGDALPGNARSSDFRLPTQVVFDNLGRMVIAVSRTSKIVRVDLATGQLEHMYGNGAREYTGDGGPATTAGFNDPAAIEYDASGNLYVMDQNNQVIRKVDGSGTISRFAGQCIIENFPAAPCLPGETPLACEGSNKLTCTADGAPYDLCEFGCTSSFAGDGGPVLAARLAQPSGGGAWPAGRMAFDAAGNLYVADQLNHRIRRIDTDGLISTVAGNGSPGHAGDGGPATLAQLDHPVDVEIASDGTLYVADTESSCVRAVSPDGIIRTVAGTCGQRGFAGDGGPATEALLDRPFGIELDRDDNLYIADTLNERIRFVPR